MYENEGIRHIEIHRKVKPDDEDEISEIDKPIQHEQLLRGDSDQVSLDSLLKAVIDINDCLNHQEEKLQIHECNVPNETSSKHKKRNDKMFPVTAVRKYNRASFSSDSDLDQSQTSSKLSSKLSAATCRSKQSMRFSPSPSKDGFTEGRKNISFSNDSVRQIDMENQRLLKEILHTKSKTLNQRKGNVGRPQSASTINRLRQQKEIDRENLRLLNRLQSVKATKALSRDNLLSDHNRNLECSSRISRSSRSRPSSAFVTRSMDTHGRSIDTFDNESILSSPSVRSIRSTSSKGTRSTSARSSRPASAKKKQITVRNVWEPGW